MSAPIETVLDLFDRQVEQSPQAEALAFGDRALTYAELGRRSTELARHLRVLGLGPEDVVGICAERSPEMVVAVLGVLRAGAAYLPLAPEYPRERLRFLLEDSGAGLVLATSGAADRLPVGIPRLLLDENREPAEQIDLPVADPGRAAYLIYTSGSTGTPKGVMVEHRGIPCLALAQARTFDIRPGDRVLQFASFSFDASVSEIWTALVSGATLVLAPREEMLPGPDLIALLRSRKVTHVTLPPSALAVLPDTSLPDLRTICVAGEACPPALARTWSRGRRFVNAYGPTEATVCATMAEVTGDEGDRLPIGLPFPGVSVHVLDGELCIGGAGLARGYRGRPDLTAERFIPAFCGRAGERLYRTGDLGRWRDDGQLEFLGRVDHQVKVRGFRIEPGEIEAALLAHPDVREAAVLALESGEDVRLVAYVVTSRPVDLGRHLEASLPAFMIPSAFVFLDAMPLTPNGKVDRKALPAPRLEERQVGEAPGTPTEDLLAGIWAGLLGLGTVGVGESFFDLGGHSLLAGRLLSRLTVELGIELSIRDVFEAPTVSRLAARIDAARGEHSEALPLLSRPHRDGDLLPLSFAQERLWVLDRLSPGLAVYNLPFALRLRGHLDLSALERALDEIARRHETLRTVFGESGGRPHQVVLPFAPQPLPVIDLPEAEAGRWLVAKALEPFDLGREPLFRRAVLRLGGSDHFLFLDMHHIVSDGWSMEVFGRELAVLYAVFLQGLDSPLAPLPVQYSDFAIWERERLSEEALEREIAWWRDELAGAPTLLELPTDRPRPRVQSFRGARRSLALPAALAGEVKSLARASGATLFMTLLAAWQTLVHRLTMEPGSVLVGSPIGNRRRREIEDLIGFFVNTLVLRGRFEGDVSFRELLGRVRTSALGAYSHPDLPFERLVVELRIERSLGHNPLFQVGFAFQAPPMAALGMPGLELEPKDLQGLVSKFDLFLALWESPDGLAGSVDYATDLFDAVSVERLLGSFQMLLASLVAQPDSPVSEAPLLSEPERAAVLVEWNDAWTNTSRAATLHEIFQEQAARTPGAVAVTFESRGMTYRELDRRSNDLALRLRELGLEAEGRAGICVERSPELIVAILAILKAGGAYVPLDPAYPDDRLGFVIEDAGLLVVLTQESLIERISALGRVRPLALDAPIVAGLESGEAPAVAVTAEQAAYVIYTSGSTGRPKGVVVTHRNVVRLFTATEEWFGFGPGDTWSLFHSYAFDFSVWEIWGALLYGGRLVVVPYWASRSPEDFYRLLREEGVTVLNQTPSAFGQLAQAASSDLALRYVIFGGEALNFQSLEPWWRRHPEDRPRLVNMYGITETTVHVTYRPLSPADLSGAPGSRIGRAIPDLPVYVLDHAQRPVPVGVAGEMCVGGEGLARGYLRRPELTAERFIPDPFGGRPGARLYRSGDLARWRPTGELEYLGRMDHQVKIRGFRIELGEIEAALVRLVEVEAAVVVVREDAGNINDRRLVAYVVPSPGQTPDALTLRAALLQELPDYMVPARFILLESLPLTSNGKVDRRALPAPSRDEAAAGDSMPPRTPTEELLAGIWAEILDLDSVGIEEDFFALGGHSLLATRLVSRVGSIFGVELPLRTVFEAPTVAALAARIDAALAGSRSLVSPILPRPRLPGEPLPLSFAQERLWVLDRLLPGLGAYNVPLALSLSGALEVAALEAALGEIVRRHESLRTTFHEIGGQPRQVVSPVGPWNLPVIDFRSESAARIWMQEEAVRPFDLASGPLMRAALLRFGDDRFVLFLSLHHIVGDGWSMDVLVRELAALYSASPLPELPVQYVDFALWQRERLSGELLERQIAWWREELADAPAVLELPSDRPRPSNQSFRGDTRRAALPTAVAGRARDVAREHGATLFMALLASFQALLFRLSGQADVLVGSPIANRDRSETEGLIGFFVNTLVLRGRFEGGVTFRELVSRTRATALEAYVHQDLPFERLVEELRVERSLAYNPLFQVMLDVEPAPMAGLDLPGLAVSPIDLQAATSKFDLSLTLAETSEGLTGDLVYATDLFDATTMRRFLSHFHVLLEAALADPDCPIDGLPLLSEPEAHQILEWNDTSLWKPAELPVHVLFEEQAALHPGATAVVFEGESLTFGELDRRANRLAGRLRKLGVARESRVGLCVERSLDLPVGVLAIWKAGGAYVPLDPHQPEERLSFLIEDALLSQEVPVLVTQEPLAERLPGLDRVRLALFEDDGEEGPVPLPVFPRDLAYLIYTSGTTGRPKAVLVEHGNLSHTLRASQETFGIQSSDRMPCLAAFTFDIFLFELLAPLLAGGTSVIFPLRPTLDIPRLVESLDGMTLLHGVPALMRELVAGVERRGTRTGLRQIFVGGDAVPPDLLLDMSQVFPEARITVLYGPTEATIICSRHEAGHVSGRALLGRPLPDSVLEVRDGGGRPVPIGAPGEVWIGGPGVTRGYLNQPELTTEKFVSTPGARWYRSGDRARWLPDGNLEFLGRTDQQVKIRGFRVEPGEIESVLVQHPAVRQAAVVVVDQGGDRRLAGFVVADTTDADLRGFLTGRLPEYMIPPTFTVVDEIPLTAHGKVDRRELERRAPADAGSDSDAAPRTPTEVALAVLWADVLGVAQVGLLDNFFKLGGHSLMATRLVSRVADELGVELPLRAVFEAPILADMAERIDVLRASGSGILAPPVVPVRRDRDLPLSFAQERLWFLHQLDPLSPAYNIMAGLRLAGPLDVAALQASLSEIVRRHESLRTTYANGLSGAVQRIAPPSPVRLSMADLRSLPDARTEALRLVHEEAAIPFDLHRGPVTRFRVLRLGEAEWLLLLTVHHIASDGWSTGVLIEELTDLYGALAQGQEPSLPEMPVQYGDFAVWQRDWLQGETLERLLGFWRQTLAGAPARIDLPTDRPRPAAQSYRGATRPLTLPSELLRAAEAASREMGSTLFMTLLACFQVLLHRITRQDDVLVGAPVAGRTRGETERVIGCFINTLVLRGQLATENVPFREVVRQVRARTLDAYVHQDLPLEKLIEDLNLERSLSYNPLFQVLFSLQNAPARQPELHGLELSLVEGESEISLFDLTLGLGEFRGEILGGFQYSVDLFDPSTIDRWAAHFRGILEAAVQDPDKALRDLPRLTEPERLQVLSEPAAAAPEQSEEVLQARIAGREDELAEKRAGLSDQKRAALEKLLKARRRPA